jgi:ribose 5-phosphate isomerase B
VIVCGSGAGAAIAANKLTGIRAAVAHDTYTAHQMVEHDDVNILALGSRVVGQSLAEELIRTFIEAKFSRDERHVRRLDKIRALEA